MLASDSTGLRKASEPRSLERPPGPGPLGGLHPTPSRGNPTFYLGREMDRPTLPSSGDGASGCSFILGVDDLVHAVVEGKAEDLDS